MRQLKTFIDRFDRGYLVVLVICIVAIWPFISRPSLPRQTDAELHIFRLHELSYLVRGGEIYPRWAPNFYHGYGYPIFNYYAPLVYYLGLVVELLPRLGAVAGVKAVFVAGLLLAAWGMYGFMRDNWGRPAAYVATAVYLYAPYIQYVDPHARGVLAESFSFGVFPLALWSLDRLRRGGGTWAWTASVLTVAAVILTHNLMGLLFFTLLFAWALWHLATSWSGRQRRKNGRTNPDSSSARSPTLLLLALLLGLGVAAFFWLPVFLEREAVNLNTVIGQGDNFDFRLHFLSWRELLSFSKWLDWGATEPAFRLNLGVAQWVLGGVGILLLLARRVKHATHLAFFALTLAVLIFLMLPVSVFVWEWVPLLPFFQFPWRLLGAAVAVLAILAGAGAEGLVRGRQRAAWITAVFVAVPLLLGLPLSQPLPWSDFGQVNTLRMSLLENEGRWLGTTSTSDFVPATVDIIPRRRGSVVAPLNEGNLPNRINWKVLPEGATVETERVRPLFTRYTISTPKAFKFRLYLFHFPGWTARVDGEEVEIELGRPEGFVVVSVPAGEHVVEVEFTTTPARTLATVLSLSSLLVTLLVAWRRSAPKDSLSRGSLPALRVSSPDFAVLALVVGITAVHLLLLQPWGVLRHHSTGFTAEPAQVNTVADFGGQIALVGYDTSARQAAPGDTLRLSLYWKAQQDLEINYQVFVHVLGPDGIPRTQSDKLNPGEFPTSDWPLDKYVRDEHTLLLPADLPPGEYSVSVGLWVQSEGWRLPLWNETEQQIGDHYPLFKLTVR